MITGLVVDFVATNDQCEQLLLQLGYVEELDLTSIQLRFQRVIEGRFRRSDIVGDAQSSEVAPECQAGICIAMDPRYAILRQQAGELGYGKAWIEGWPTGLGFQKSKHGVTTLMVPMRDGEASVVARATAHI